jgi:uncharacterized membrane-anchored protein
VDRRTKNLLRRVQPGEVAVIDHEDLDRVSAEGLVQRGVSAVVNAARSISGRYPNLGPLVLAESGIPLIDGVGKLLLSKIQEGDPIRVEGDRVYVADELVAVGVRQTHDSVVAAMEVARQRLADQFESFAANTVEFMARERDLLFGGEGLPELRHELSGRHVLVVVRGYHYREDLAALRAYIRELRPVLVGVDGGADALLEEGYRPHLIVGDMDSVSDATLRCGAEILVHGYRAGEAPGAARLERLGIPYQVVSATGISEDMALLLAYEKGAELIVAVGTHLNLIEFLERNRAGMSSTFVTRLKVGEILVDAKGVSRLVSPGVGVWPLVVFAIAALGAVVAAIAASPALRHLFELLARRLGLGG